MVNRQRMEEQLVLHEGLRRGAYLDSENNWTVGVGYNLTARGFKFLEEVLLRPVRPADGDPAKVVLTREESLLILRADIDWFERTVPIHFPYYTKLDEVRQRVVLDMAFNMGFKALGFKQARAAIERRDWSRAARELYNSKWANQVGDGEGKKFDRCDRLARMLLTGQDYTR